MERATEEEQRALDGVLLHRIHGVAPLLAALLVLLALTKRWAEPSLGPQDALLLSSADLAAAAGLVAVCYLIHARWVGPRHANPAASALVGIILLDAIAHALVLARTPGAEAITFLLVMVASALFFTRTPWFVGAVAVAVLGLIGAGVLATQSPAGAFSRIGVHIVTSVSVASILYVVHRRTMLDAERHRVVAEERARSAEALAEDLRVTGRELESFAYTAAHDLRAPLRAIRAHTDALEESASALSAEDRRHLTRIARESERLGALVQDLLELAQVGRARIDIARVDVSAMANDVVQELRDGDPARRVDVDVAQGLVADADPALLRSVLENLLGNAWKFTRLRPDARIQVGETDSPHGRAIYVRDNGIGFAQPEARLLFRPFRRLANAAAFEGSGVGLASVERAIRRHGGHVWAESKPGMGATFSFTLAPPPRAEPPLDLAAEPVASPRRRHAWRARRG